MRATLDTTHAANRSPWMVAILTCIAFLTAVDRQSFASLLVPIQRDLHVSDTAMGALTGAAFSLVYAFVALPLARLADRVNRRNLIAICVTLWSIATLSCGLAGSYAPLLLARMAVGGSEAGELPAAMSVISDIAPAERRGTPIGLWNGGSALGFASGGFIGGIINDHFGWHIAMLAVGAPGLGSELNQLAGAGGW